MNFVCLGNVCGFIKNYVKPCTKNARKADKTTKMTNLELIAKLAGVSRGTVDRVLHNRGQVRPETEEKVRAVMQELDFQPNALGRAFYLSRKKNKIGILVAFREPDFQKQVMQGVNEGVVYAQQHGVEVLIEYAHPDDTEGYLASLRRLLDGGVRGLAIRGVLSDEIDRCLREISPAATTAAEPPDEPPGTRSRSCGLCVGCAAEFSQEEPIANSSMFALPVMTASAAVSFSMTVALYGGLKL